MAIWLDWLRKIKKGAHCISQIKYTLNKTCSKMGNKIIYFCFVTGIIFLEDSKYCSYYWQIEHDTSGSNFSMAITDFTCILLPLSQYFYISISIKNTVAAAHWCSAEKNVFGKNVNNYRNGSWRSTHI